MRTEDQLALLISCFDYQTLAREQRKIQQHLEELERHREEIAASSERRADQLRASALQQEARLEQRERELMYFCEFDQRAVEWKIKEIENRGCAAETVKMIKEDQLAHAVAAQGRAQKEAGRISREELAKVVAAKWEGVRLHGGDGSKNGRSLAERNFAAKAYSVDRHYDAVSVRSGSLAAVTTSSSNLEMIVNEFNELRPQLSVHMRLARLISKDDCMESKSAILMRVSQKTDCRYFDLFTKLHELARIREIRKCDYRFLLEALAYFEVGLRRLTHLRHVNRTIKFESRKARQDVLNEAISLENRLSILQSDAEKYGMKLVAVMKEEMEIFQYLFIQGGKKDFVFTISPHLFKLKTEAAEEKVAGSWLQQKKKNPVISRRASKADVKGLTAPSSKNALAASKMKLSESELWFHETEEFLQTAKLQIDQIDMEYFSSIASTTIDVAQPPELFEFESCGSDARKARRGATKVPGLSLFLDPSFGDYGFWQWSRRVLKWASAAIVTMTTRERAWRSHYRTQLISFYQRMQYVCLTELALSITSSAAVLNPYDTTAPWAVDRADVIDLYKLLCCRVKLNISVPS